MGLERERETEFHYFRSSSRSKSIGPNRLMMPDNLILLAKVVLAVILCIIKMRQQAAQPIHTPTKWPEGEDKRANGKNQTGRGPAVCIRAANSRNISRTARGANRKRTSSGRPKRMGSGLLGQGPAGWVKKYCCWLKPLWFRTKSIKKRETKM